MHSAPLTSQGKERDHGSGEDPTFVAIGYLYHFVVVGEPHPNERIAVKDRKYSEKMIEPASSAANDDYVRRATLPRYSDPDLSVGFVLVLVETQDSFRRNTV